MDHKCEFYFTKRGLCYDPNPFLQSASRLASSLCCFRISSDVTWIMNFTHHSVNNCYMALIGINSKRMEIKEIKKYQTS